MCCRTGSFWRWSRLPFVVTPIVVRSLGIERYGIWSFLNGLLAYSELLYFGLGSALVKYAAQYRARDDIAASTGWCRLSHRSMAPRPACLLI